MNCAVTVVDGNIININKKYWKFSVSSYRVVSAIRGVEVSLQCKIAGEVRQTAPWFSVPEAVNTGVSASMTDMS